MTGILDSDCFILLQDVLEYKNKVRILKIRTLDGAIRRIQVDDSHTVGQLLITITSRIGTANVRNQSAYKSILSSKLEPSKRPVSQLELYTKKPDQSI